MIEQKEKKKTIPPYISYKTLCSFLDSMMAVGVPTRIDRSLMRTMSGAIQSQLISTLEYLDLRNPNTGVPTEKLTSLLHSEGLEKQGLLKRILESSYEFIFNDGLDLERATEHELQERFTQTGTSGDTTRKAIAFFKNVSKEAGLALSPHIIRTRGPRKGTTRSKPKGSQREVNSQLKKNSDEEPPSVGEISWEKLLLSKFPSFDPSWPNDVKVKWFDGFKDLMKYKLSDAKKNEEGG